MEFLTSALVLGVLIIIFLTSAIKIVSEYERGVIFRLGRLVGAKGPGLFFMIPIVDRMVKVDLRTITMDVPPQEVITKDNVPAKVNAVVYFRVLDASRSVVEVENYVMATSQIAQTTLRSILGQSDLDHLLTERVKVTMVEVKDVEIPQTMQRAMARQAEAERERRAKVIAAEGEFQASEKLSSAALIMDQTPTSIQLRYLQTLVEVAAEKNSTTIFPIPIDLFEPFLHKAKAAAGGDSPTLSDTSE